MEDEHDPPHKLEVKTDAWELLRDRVESKGTSRVSTREGL